MPPPASRILLSALLAVAASVAASCDRGAAGTPDPRPASRATERIPLRLDDCIVLGASVSAGAEVVLPGLPPKMVEGHANLADVLGAITDAPPPASVADMMFFARPSEIAETQLRAALDRPTPPRIVFAIDYLFWHAYGAVPSDEHRRRMFERGLERLALLRGPVVVADIPDMSHAVGMMLFKDQVPSLALQEEFNQRLAAWARERPNVLVLGVRRVVAGSMAQASVTLGGRTFEGADARELLVANGLHATADGLIALALECLGQLRDRGHLPAAAAWETDAAEIRRRLIAAKTPSSAPR